ncbi:hypothetical protein BDV18DRAFT_147022 [Aspergillus unguis]
MTAVLPFPVDSHSSFSSDPERRPLTQTYFLDNTADAMSKSLPPLYTASDFPSPLASSTASSSPASPDLGPISSQNPPPTTTGYAPGQDDELMLPPYEGGLFSEEGSSTPSDDNLSSISLRSAPQIPAADDSSVEEKPSRHVDYLSHDWKNEEDIWTSWRYVTSRRDAYENSIRLENASWRTWTKLRHNLGTVSPDALNWLKDCDVTWLYGPLKTSRVRKSMDVSPPPSYFESPGHRKSILKKRSASETMLQRSLSQHTLLQHAGAILKAQQAQHFRSRSTVDIYRSRRGSMADNSYDGGLETPRARFETNMLSAGAGSPGEKRHIHFNKEVLQCIAVEAKDEEEEYLEFGGDSSWDDSFIVKSASSSGQTTPRGSTSGDNKTIAPLPSTTLKCRDNTPEPPSSGSSRWSWAKYIPGHKLYSSSFGRTSRRSQSSSSINGVPPTPGYDWANTDDSSNSWFVDSADDDEDSQNFYLASLGFLPQENGGQPSNTDVLFDRVTDTVNTAKDIAHVIWNVGWRG